MLHQFDNINTIKLTTELSNAKITWGRCDVVGRGSILIEFTDETDMDLVQQIIDAHDPTPIPTISNEEVLSAKIENQTLNLLIDLGVI